MRKCLAADLNIEYTFIKDSTIIDDDALEIFVNTDKRIPEYRDGFFYKPENIDRLFALEDKGVALLWKLDKSVITEDVIDRLIEYGDVGIEVVGNFSSSILDTTTLSKLLALGDKSIDHINRFPVTAWTDENIEKVIEILKGNPNLKLNKKMYKIQICNCKALLKRCIEEDVDYSHFTNDTIFDSEIVQLIIDKHKSIPSFSGGFFSKEKNFKMILGLNGGIGYLRNFKDSVFTEENKDLYVEAIREHGIEYKYNPNSMLYWMYFYDNIRKDTELFDRILTACLDSKSVTVFRDFDKSSLWTDERIDAVLRNN